ncbi:MAG: substrate-binding domain-containing protein [Lachnospiraceae bacterium]|nr:substrate-binding domain-containing protein [Lachnospiraceae bacterium]
MKRTIAALLMIVMVVALCGCGAKEEKKGAPRKEITKPTIGICFDTFVVERWIKDRDIFTTTATELGANVEVLNANSDAQKQREQVQHCIDEGVDALVIVAVDATVIKDLLEEARSKGIKIIAYDRFISDACVDLYVSFDNTEVGKLMAQAINDKLGDGRKNVLMICGAESDKNVAMVNSGFEQVAKTCGFNIVDKTFIEGWRAENVDTYFQQNPGVLKDIDAVMCGNDNLAGKVVQILAENRMAGEVAVTGQDADLEACQRIVEGTQLMTVYKPIEALAEKAAEMTIDLINGRELNGIPKIDNGYEECPYVTLQQSSVTKENMDEVIIESGFYLKEDVYLNVEVTPNN